MAWDNGVFYDEKNLYKMWYQNKFPRKIVFDKVNNIEYNEDGDILLGQCLAHTEEEAIQITVAIEDGICRPEDLTAERVGSGMFPVFMLPNKPMPMSTTVEE